MTDAIAQSLSRVGLEAGLEELDITRSNSTPEIAKVIGDTLVLAADASIDAAPHVAKALAFAREATFTDQEKKLWSKALISPGNERILEVASALKDSTSYREAVESLESPVTRLVAIVLFNALISSGTSFANAKTVDFAEWGSTAPYVNGNGKISLIPLLGAYAPTDVYTVFACAVECLVSDNLSKITHSDLREEFSKLVVSLFNGMA